MRWFQWFRKSSEKVEPKLYKSISDLPQYTWNKIHDTSDLSLLVIDGDVDDETLQQTWLTIYDEYIGTCGISAQYLKRLNNKKKIALLKVKLMITGNKVYNTKIKILELESEEQSTAEGMTFERMLAYVEKFMGFKLGMKTVTVLEYDNYIKLMNSTDGKED